jgi:hypothetical protein
MHFLLTFWVNENQLLGQSFDVEAYLQQWDCKAKGIFFTFEATV